MGSASGATKLGREGLLQSLGAPTVTPPPDASPPTSIDNRYAPAPASSDNRYAPAPASAASGDPEQAAKRAAAIKRLRELTEPSGGPPLSGGLNGGLSGGLSGGGAGGAAPAAPVSGESLREHRRLAAVQTARKGAPGGRAPPAQRGSSDAEEEMDLQIILVVWGGRVRQHASTTFVPWGKERVRCGCCSQDKGGSSEEEEEMDDSPGVGGGEAPSWGGL
ncbi:hypothetical protein T484DRAFT_1773650 [Baffinella frigidus]|nr:hypothetical protein T484DRAFT_1773650 [Cryptophyta sp. CCMP2293]